MKKDSSGNKNLENYNPGQEQFEIEQFRTGKLKNNKCAKEKTERGKL